jgi:hypothetical protein
MTVINRVTNEPVSFAGAVLDRYRHVCAFLNSRDEEQRIFDPFVIDGLERGETMSYIVDPAKRVDRVRHFRQLGLDMPRLLNQGRFELRTWSETHLRGGRFDQDAMLCLSDEAMSRSESPRIRMVSDMGWAVEQQGAGDLIEYEARANDLVSKYQHVVICVYDTAKFGGDVVIDVLRTHPMVLIGGLLQVNPFFVPPEQLLEELRQRGRRAPDA